MSKRIITFLTLLVVFSFILAACQPSATAEPTKVEEKTAEATADVPKVPEACSDNPDETVCAVIEPGETIKIGYAGPMTGDYSAFGTDISQGGSIAITDFGAFEGFQFELLVEDTQGGGEGGAQVANLYSSDPNVVAIAGHTFSGSTAAAIPIYNQSRRPMLSPSATRADLTGGDQDVFNRIPFTDDLQGAKAAEYLYTKLGFTQIAVMHDGDAYGQGLAETVRDDFIKLGGEVVAFEAITPGEADYSGPLNAISAFAPQAIYYGGYDAEAAVLRNQMVVAGLADAVFFACDGVFGLKFLELTGANAEGSYATSSLPPASDARANFDAAYLIENGVESGTISAFTWHGYDVVAALIQVVKDTAILGEDGNLYIPRDALVQNVRNLTDYAGLTGTLTCNEVGECNATGPTFFVVENGEWVQAP